MLEFVYLLLQITSTFNCPSSPVSFVLLSLLSFCFLCACVPHHPFPRPTGSSTHNGVFSFSSFLFNSPSIFNIYLVSNVFTTSLLIIPAADALKEFPLYCIFPVPITQTFAVIVWKCFILQPCGSMAYSL